MRLILLSTGTGRQYQLAFTTAADQLLGPVSGSLVEANVAGEPAAGIGYDQKDWY